MRLITDRTAQNVSRLAQLSGRSWDSMTDAERAEWSGDPLTAGVGGYMEPVNLLPPTGKNVKVRQGSITATVAGSIVVGDAEDFAGETVTLSTELMSEGGSLALKWSDGTDAGGSLSSTGSVTITIPTAAGKQLVLDIAPGYYSRVMLEMGRMRHEYAPYTEILPTMATKGAYNYSDLNRVETAVRDIAESIGLPITTKTDWSAWDVPTTTDMGRFRNNVVRLRDLCGLKDPLPASMSSFSYADANAIESVLLKCKARVDAITRCGEIITGEVT